MEDEFDSDNAHLLKEPISFADLVEKGAHFEIDTADINGFSYDDFDVGSDDGNAANDINNEELVSPWTRSFDELRSLMTPIDEHMYKRVTREGFPDRGLVPEKARVSLRYSAYWEGEGAPFDSSLLRGTKFEFETGQGNVIEGLEAAVRTMCPCEQAEFIISYHLLFRELGCPPRVKPRADALFKIEVLNYILIGDVQALEQVSAEDRRKFVVVYPKAKEIHLHGKDCVKRNAFHNAVNVFERAINALNFCRVADEEEERQQTALLITLYTNVMICCNKINKPQRACTMMKALRRLTLNKPSCKALFQEGRALVALGEYDRARKVYAKAQSMQPGNKEISDEIISVDERISKYQKASRDIWTRALCGQNQAQEKKEEDSSVAEYNEALEVMRQGFENMLKDFQNTDTQSICMSKQMYTDEEFHCLRKLANQFNMSLNLSALDKNVMKLEKQTKIN